MKKYTIYAFGFLLLGCTKVDVPQPQNIDLGIKSAGTSIKSIVQSGNVITADFQTTIGAKYSIQVIPFGKDEPVRKEGFTASDTLTKKVLNLSDLPKRNYDIIFIDITGNEVKYPIIIK
jgi:hypothetical protein